MPRHRVRKSRPRRRPRRYAKTRVPRTMPAMAGKNQMATCIETLDRGTLLANAGQLYTFTLGQFPRAYAMSTLFSFYKATKVIWTYEPLFNTFQEGAGAVGKPYIVTQMNRQQEVVTTGYRNLISSGGRPTPLASVKKITYTPNWCSPGLSMYQGNFSTGDIQQLASTGLQKQFGWLASPPATPIGAFNPGTSDNSAAPINDTVNGTIPVVINYNNVTYNGHASHIFQDGALNNPICRVTCQVQWVFKGAKNNYNFTS